jgi:hypothetical protein
MSSVTKQKKRAKRAKTKAKQTRIARNATPSLTPIVPDYFMPDTMPLDDPDFEDIDDLTLLENYIEPELLATMDDEEREAALAVFRGDDLEMLTEDELLLMDVYESPAAEPSDEQRIAHYQALKKAEQEGRDALLAAFVRGPIAAHALYDIDFANYLDILTGTLGAYWSWSEGIDEQTARARIDNAAFLEAMREALADLEEELIVRMVSGPKKTDEPSQD